LEAARESRDAIILIWSPDARSQLYMLEWAHKIDPTRLIEIALTPDAPKTPRKAPVVDFTAWRGVRGNKEWSALKERIKAVGRAINPPKPPPKYAAFAVGVARAAAVAGALVLRMDQTNSAAPLDEAAPNEALIAGDPEIGLGGPLIAREPASLDDGQTLRVRPLNLQPIRTNVTYRLAELDEPAQIQLRNETLLELLNGRINDGMSAIDAINPLRREPSAQDQSN
jgi:hypothetical protein